MDTFTSVIARGLNVVNPPAAPMMVVNDSSGNVVTGSFFAAVGAIGVALDAEIRTRPVDTTFVFGHTHKPFVGTRGIDGFARPVQVVNTGGWVVDHPLPEPVKGASIVLIDDALNTVALEMYRQRPDGSVTPPHVVPIGPGSRSFAEEVANLLHRNEATWNRLAPALGAAVVTRRRGLAAREAATVDKVRRA